MNLQARCLRGNVAWLHINWYDDGRYLNGEIAGRVCTPGIGDYRMRFQAPAGTIRGAVVLDAQPDVQMEISDVELKQKGRAR